MRATITMEIEGRDYLAAQQAKASIEAMFTEIRRGHETASLVFRQCRPRTRPRPAAPGPIVAAYADD